MSVSYAACERDAEHEIGELIDARRRVGRLRRALAPHREVFAALCVSAFDPISTEESARRFGKLAAKTETAAFRSPRREERGHRLVRRADRAYRAPNERDHESPHPGVDLAAPGALIAGVMGMNFHPSIFQHTFLFWVVNGVIVLIALATLAIARARRWI